MQRFDGDGDWSADQLGSSVHSISNNDSALSVAASTNTPCAFYPAESQLKTLQVVPMSATPHALIQIGRIVNER